MNTVGWKSLERMSNRGEPMDEALFAFGKGN
jgi:hypothetical protein